MIASAATRRYATGSTLASVPSTALSMAPLHQLLLSVALALALATHAYGVKLYKWTDEDGRVTYQDRPPPSAGGNVEEKDINPNQNRADSFVPPPSNASNPSAAGRRNAVDETDTPASRAAAARRHRRTIQGGGAVDSGGSSAGGPPAPPAPPPSVPAGTGGG